MRAAERHPAIFEAIAALAPDVAALQELTPLSLAALRARGGALLPEDPGWVDPYGVGLWSPRGSESHTSWRLPGGKATLLAHFNGFEHPLSVLVVHLSSDYHADADARRAQEMAAALAALPPEGAAVVLGDLNCAADARPPALAEQGFREVWPALHPDEPGFTWNPGANTLADAVAPAGRPRRLDALYWRPGPFGLRPVRVERVQPLAAPGLPCSDHDGVVADFVWGS